MVNAIYLDMDGTFVSLYGVPNWLAYLEAEDTTPYEVAKPLVNLSLLARYLNKAQAKGICIGIVSWTSKSGSLEYNERVTEVKMNYLRRHLPSVQWDEIHIVPYGFPKSMAVDFADGILFDDEARNRDEWQGTAYDVDNILEILKGIAAEG